MASTTKHDWPIAPLLEIAEDVTRGHKKVPKSAYEEVGSTPIVDQSMDFICGYTNEVPTLVSPPYIVFGDHTRELKYIDFAFVPGADGVKVLKPAEGIEPKFLYYYLQAHPVQDLGYSRHFKLLKELSIPLPPLDEQRRIAAILDEVDRLVLAQCKKVDCFKGLKRVAIEEFLKDKWNQEVELSTISEIQSGITKGRKVSKETSTSIVPYLAVSNVKDGFLQLDPIKEINATDDEIARYQLKPGDIVLTEGGDPDKLGRGTVWNNEISICIHQNHIFRVRILKDSTEMMPEVLAAILSSSRPKKYFLRSAKQTTGIASINKSQLCRTPIPTLKRDEVRALSLQIESLKSELEKAESLRSSFEELRQSLSTRAFQGEL